jgi:uncharacterized protein (TIGR03437 family)
LTCSPATRHNSGHVRSIGATTILLLGLTVSAGTASGEASLLAGPFVTNVPAGAGCPTPPILPFTIASTAPRPYIWFFLTGLIPHVDTVETIWSGPDRKQSLSYGSVFQPASLTDMCFAENSFDPATAAPGDWTVKCLLNNNTVVFTLTVTVLPAGAGGGPVLVSDSFNRADAPACALGQADLAFGGVAAHYYVPLFGGSLVPVGASLVSHALQNNGLDFGGVQLTPAPGACTNLGLRGETFAQDLNIKVDLLVPKTGSNVTAAGPYFRGPSAAAGDTIIGPANFGYWVELVSTGEVKLVSLSTDLVAATTDVPASFNPAVIHTLQMAAQGSNLQVSLDGQLLTFIQNGGFSTTVILPASGGTNNGAVGVAFGSEPNRGMAGGQRAANLVVSVFSPLPSGPGPPACAYTLKPTFAIAPAVSSAATFSLTASAPACVWTASSNVPWIRIAGGGSGMGNGVVSYQVDPNTGPTRSGTLIVAGLTFSINQAAGGSGSSIVNAASFAPSPPNGLAQGSYFSILGANLGPDVYVQAPDSQPFPVLLAGITVQIVQGANTYYAYLSLVSSSQINGILPSNVPLGTAQVIVNYNGLTNTGSIVVSKTSFGVFFQVVNGNNAAVAQNVASATSYPLNTASTPAQPGQIVIVWGTGIGPLASGADNAAPGANAVNLLGAVTVAIKVGGVPATPLYAGRQSQTAAVDNIYFTVPQGVPLGCNVPVEITAGDVAANTTTIAISADGSPCK